MSDLFPEDPALSLFSRRYAEQDFDPTVIRPIISPATQAKPKTIPTIKADEPIPDSPQERINQIINSPKRPLHQEEDDNDRPRKVARPESPLKGAAGRRLDQQKRNRQPQEMPQFNHPMPQPPPPPPLPRDVMFLLSIIPKAETYHATKFSAEQIVRLLRETNIPNSLAQVPPPLGARGPPPSQPPPPFQQMPPMPQTPYGQYAGQYNGEYPSLYSMFL